MRRDGPDAPIHADTIASAQAVRGFRRDEGKCCDAGSFCLDFASSPGTPWNRSARTVFVNDFLDVHLYDCTDRQKIEAMFNAHFRMVKKHYEKQQADTTAADHGVVLDRTPEQIAKARWQCMYNV